MRNIPGLFALIFFTTFNNFLGGVFFALMDAYGLSMVSVQAWGTLWGVLSPLARHSKAYRMLAQRFTSDDRVD